MLAGHGRIAVVLDRSQSMMGIAGATVSGYNEFIDLQKAAPGTADVLLAQFDDEYEIVYDLPLSKVPALTRETFLPRGNTALYDAIGRTISTVGASLAEMKEKDRPDSVTVLILTDGHENASREYTQARIAEMIKHQTETYKWKFVFVGANQDAVLTAETFNIPRGQTMSYSASSAGVGNTMRSVGEYTISNRVSAVMGTVCMNFSDEDRTKAMATDPDPAAAALASLLSSSRPHKKIIAEEEVVSK